MRWAYPCLIRVLLAVRSADKKTTQWLAGQRQYISTIGIECLVVHSRLMKRTVVWLTGPQAKALARMSAKSLVPISALVRQAVKEFLKKKRKSHAPNSSWP